MAMSEGLNGVPQNNVSCHNSSLKACLATWLGIFVVLVSKCGHMHLVGLDLNLW